MINSFFHQYFTGTRWLPIIVTYQSCQPDDDSSRHSMEIQIWDIERFILYGRNPRKNDAAVDRMCASIREFGFKIPVLARSDGNVVDGHLRLKAARKLQSWLGGDTTCIPVILWDEWTDAQVKAFRLMVNRSVAWADWDEELLALELQELNAAARLVHYLARPSRSTNIW